MHVLLEILNRDTTKKIVSIAVIILMLYLLRDLLNLFLLTFLLTYLLYSLQKFIIKILSKVIPLNSVFVIVVIYCTLITIIALVIYKYVPILITEIADMVDDLAVFKLDLSKYKYGDYLMPIINQIDFKNYIKEGSNYIIKFASNVGSWSYNVIAAFILSIFFQVENEKVKIFFEKFGKSRISWFYNYMKYLGANFLNSFGKVIQAQIIIALINSVLSVIFLSILGFPKLLAIGAMVFILGLIPVAGVIISLIPLSIIAFNIGGFIIVMYVLILVVVLHSLESYFLNPKLMSAKTKLPVFLIFLVLIISEHLMGLWGLLIGIPLFMFILDLMSLDLIDDNEKANLQ